MILHACDEKGDWRPVRVRTEVLSGKGAIARLIENRLRWLKGEWWENPEQGLDVLEVFREERVSEMALNRIINDITKYISETPGVVSVENVVGRLEGKEILYECRALTEEGSIDVSTSFQ